MEMVLCWVSGEEKREEEGGAGAHDGLRAGGEGAAGEERRDGQ